MVLGGLLSRGAYSVPHTLADRTVLARRSGDEVVIVAVDANGPKEMARHRPVLGRHRHRRRPLPGTPGRPERAPRASNAREEAFLALGEGARRYLAEMAANGVRGITRMDEALTLARSTERGFLDAALGICALSGRFAHGDLASVLSARPSPVHRIAEEHSLQPGTGAWEGFGR